MWIRPKTVAWDLSENRTKNHPKNGFFWVSRLTGIFGVSPDIEETFWKMDEYKAIACVCFQDKLLVLFWKIGGILSATLNPKIPWMTSFVDISLL